MTPQENPLEPVLAELLDSRAHEAEILKRMETIFDSPTSCVPKHVAEVYRLSKTAFRADAIKFLTRPNILLGDALPLCVAQDEAGARRVEDVLQHIIHGLPA